MNLAYKANVGLRHRELNLTLYRKLFLIRAAENAIRKYYREDEMKTPMHMSTGEEAITVGVCEALGPGALVFGSYRSHALYLAKTGETDRFFAEMYGKVTGVAQGKAGSMHMSAPESGLLCCAGVVAGTISLALGTAFANKIQHTRLPSAAFLGDGAMDAGVFWESLNAACVMKLPVMFVCEDNDFAVHTRRGRRQGFRSPTDVVAQFDCDAYHSDSTDAEEIYRIAQVALADMHSTGRPAFLHLKWYRYLQHVGINEDFDIGYRSKDEYFDWLKRDPVALQRGKLLNDGLDESVLKTIEETVLQQVEHSVAQAKAAPLPGKEELYSGLFA